MPSSFFDTNIFRAGFSPAVALSYVKFWWVAIWIKRGDKPTNFFSIEKVPRVCGLKFWFIGKTSTYVHLI